MKHLLTLSMFLLTTAAWGQKEVALPKDLPAYGPETPVKAPAVNDSKLDNGLTVWLVSEPGFPKISVAVAVRGGFASDPSGRPGISSLLARTIDQGTSSRSARQVAQELQAAGGDLNATPGKDFILVSTSFLSAKRDTGLNVFADLVQNASFPETEVTLAKRNAENDLMQQESEPSFLASRAMAKVLFGESPYHITSLTKASIESATPDDLRRIHAQRFRPDQALLIAVGDFENGPMLDEIRKRFSGWKAPASEPPPKTQPPSAAPTHAIFIVPRPGSVQTTLELGMFGPLRSDADFEAALVANAIYGGTFGSRLTTNIREDKGYTYSPYAAFQTYGAAGTLVTRADVRNEVTAPTLNEIFYELNRLVTTSPTDAELNQAKRYLVGTQAINLQSRDSVAQELALLWIKGLPHDEIGIYGSKVSAITASDVNAAARKYFPAAKTAIVAVGEEKVIRDAVAPFAIPTQTTP
jgi:predicted Zn-dependent peptidase